MNRKVLTPLVVLILALFVLAARFQTSQAEEVHDAEIEVTQALAESFTYQGRLTKDGAAANGLYDIRTTIFNAAAVGTQLAQDVDQDVAVSDGLFTVVISADSDVFNTGGRRWIQLEVRPAGEAAWEKLAGRQQIRPVPQATYAEYAKHLVDEGDTYIKVSPFDALQSDGGTSLTFSAKGNGRLEIYGNQAVRYVYIPVDVPSQIFGGGHQMALKSMTFCYNGFINNGIPAYSRIRKATVRQIDGMGGSTNLLGETYSPALANSDECVSVSADTPQVITGSIWVRFEIQANSITPLELGEISLRLTSDNFGVLP